MIILIGSEKGGVGKSTLATNLAVTLKLHKSDVVIVDADRQSTSANWAQDRDETSLIKIDCIRQYDNLKPTLERLQERYKFVIVDCQGRVSKEMRTGLLAAHAVIVPFKPSKLDLDTLPAMLDIIKEAQDFNSTLKPYALMTMCPTNPHMTEISQAREFFTNHPDISLLDTIIYERKIYRDATSSGLGVVELDNEKATIEIESLLKEFIKKYNASTKEELKWQIK